MTTTYETIISLSGDNYRPFEEALYPEADPADLIRGFLMGPTDPKAALEYLQQWDYGDPTEPYAPPTLDPNDPRYYPWGTYDETYETDEYVMAWSTGLSHATLYRKVEGCTLRRSTLDAQVVCVKCGPDCDCYVCLPSDDENND